MAAARSAGLWRRRHAWAGRAALGAACAAAGAGAQAASFECTGPLTAVERRVCADPALSQLDEYLARYYQAARSGLRRAAECLQADQRSWLRTVRDACADTACLQRSYLARLGELDGLQAGASRLESLTLPPVATLVAVLPPAADEVAAPRQKGLPALQAEGRLVNEVATGDGYVLQTPAGRRHLVVATMLLDETSERLNALVGQPAVGYRVRGAQEPKSAHFAQGACRFVYRLPG